MAEKRLLMTEELPNWFNTGNRPQAFKERLYQYAGSDVSFLQIGAYTGDATMWMLEHIIFNSGTLTDVDTWEGSDEPAHKDMNWSSVEDVYDERTLQAQDKGHLIKYKGTSDEFFKTNTKTYDFIYIDGDHTAYGVLKDAVNAYECLNIGGILAFDDYTWTAGLGEVNEPKMAIDAFEKIYRDRISPTHKDYQAWYRKTR